MRLSFLLIVVHLALSTVLMAQDTSNPSSMCWHARPKEWCNVILLTDFGVYHMTLPTDRASIRVVADWGALLNLDERNAIGASLFMSLDKEASFGPEVRYRRWLGSDQSIDFAIGLPIFGESSLTYGVVSLHGLVKWNPVHWFGIALRPELRRKGSAPGTPTVYPAQPDEPYQFHFSAGVEFGWIPGLTLTAAAGAYIGYLALAFAGR